MPTDVTANLILCETLVWERGNELPTAVRILNSIQLTPLSTGVHFFSLVGVYKASYDFNPHTLQVVMLAPPDYKVIIAAGPPQRFVYGYRLTQAAPGGFLLGTEFNVVIATLGVYWIQALLDNELVSQVPLLLSKPGQWPNSAQR